MSSRIIVHAGSFTANKTITTMGINTQMASPKLILTPSTNSRSKTNPDSKIAITSEIHKFTFYQKTTEISFKVGADISLVKGLYYIDWTIEETAQATSVTSKQYYKPTKTLVEVVAAKTSNQFPFIVNSFSGQDAFKGTRTPNIEIKIDNSPFSDVTVTPSLDGGNNSNVIFHPSALTFRSIDTTKYFQIEVTKDYDTSVGTQQIVKFVLSGTDAIIY